MSLADLSTADWVVATIIGLPMILIGLACLIMALKD